MAFRPIEKSIKQNKSASVLPTQDLNEGDLKYIRWRCIYKAQFSQKVQ